MSVNVYTMNKMYLGAVRDANDFRKPCPHCGNPMRTFDNGYYWTCANCGDFTAGYFMQYVARLERLKRRWASKHVRE